MRVLPSSVALMLLGGALVGCNGGDAASHTTPRPTSVSPAPASSEAAPQAFAGDLARRVAEAKALAVRDRGARAGKLVVVRAEKVSWPNSAYGCPQTDRAYEPGLFEGYRIVLSHGDLSYTYTAAEDTKLMECLFLE